MEPRRLLSPQPILDHLALLLILNYSSDLLLTPVLLVFLFKHWKWQRFLLGITIYMAALSAGTDNFWLYLRILALSVASAHLVKRRDVEKRACLASAAVIICELVTRMRIAHSVRAPNSLSVPGLLDLAPTYIYAQVVIFGGSIPGSRQLLWSRVARAWVSFASRYGSRPKPGSEPLVRYVEPRSVGILLVDAPPESEHTIKVYVDGQVWSQTRRDNELLAIDGLLPNTAYEIRIGFHRLTVSTASTLPSSETDSSTNLASLMPGSNHTAHNTLAGNLSAATSSSTGGNAVNTTIIGRSINSNNSSGNSGNSYNNNTITTTTTTTTTNAYDNSNSNLNAILSGSNGNANLGSANSNNGSVVSLSAVASEALANDTEQKIRKFRREVAKQLAQLKAEVETTESKLSRAARADERMRHKIHTLRDQAVELEQEINRLHEECLNNQNRAHDGSSPSPSPVSSPSPPPPGVSVASASSSSLPASHLDWDSVNAQIEDINIRISETRSAFAAKIKSSEAEIKSQKHKLSKLKERLRQNRTEIGLKHSSVMGDIQQLFEQREEARNVKIARRRKQESEFEASIARLDAGVQDLNNRSLLVKQAATQWA